MGKDHDSLNVHYNSGTAIASFDVENRCITETISIELLKPAECLLQGADRQTRDCQAPSTGATHVLFPAESHMFLRFTVK